MPTTEFECGDCTGAVGGLCGSHREWLGTFLAIYPVGPLVFEVHWYRRSKDVRLELRFDALHRRSDVLSGLRDPQHRSDRSGWSSPKSQVVRLQQSLPGYVAWKRPRRAGAVVPDLHATVRRDGPAVRIELTLSALHRWSDVDTAIRSAWKDVKTIQRQLPGYRRYAKPKRGAASVKRDFDFAEVLAGKVTGSEVGRIRDELDQVAERKGRDLLPISQSRKMVAAVQQRRSRLKRLHTRK